MSCLALTRLAGNIGRSRTVPSFLKIVVFLLSVKVSNHPVEHSDGRSIVIFHSGKNAPTNEVLLRLFGFINSAEAVKEQN